MACIAVPAAAVAGPSGQASATTTSANSVTYTDSTGEDPEAPDITTIVVSNNDAGIISFQINIPNRPQLTPDMAFFLFIDSDANAATGDPDNLGADYVIQSLGGEIILFKWDGTDFVAGPGDPPQLTLSQSYSSGATVRISASELGRTKRLNFAALVLSGLVVDPVTGELDATNVHRDGAPGGLVGMYPYEVKTAPARLVVRKLAATPARPKAGKPFALRLQAVRSDTGAGVKGGRVTCVARVGGSALRAKSGAFVGNQAVCVWAIPASAKGKTFRGSVAIVFEGLKAAKSFSGRVS